MKHIFKKQNGDDKKSFEGGNVDRMVDSGLSTSKHLNKNLVPLVSPVKNVFYGYEKQLQVVF